MMVLPQEAKCVFKGVIHDIYQWQQKMFDGTDETFEKIKRPNSVQIIATKNNKILISKEEQPFKGVFYGLFGGRQENGEAPLISAQRELREKTGHESSDWELLKVYDNLEWLESQIYLFVAKNCKKIKEPQFDAGEKIEILELSFDEFITMVKSEQFRSEFLTLELYRLQESPQMFQEFKKKVFPNNHF
ncbi:NUDIX hydrolase [Candidatus Woesearchaeota archaeon]|nr:NUDIX hydrolase [Candidatus Woesearchaeota archaeon]